MAIGNGERRMKPNENEGVGEKETHPIHDAILFIYILSQIKNIMRVKFQFYPFATIYGQIAYYRSLNAHAHDLCI